jgi:hypothetical protein
VATGDLYTERFAQQSPVRMGTTHHDRRYPPWQNADNTDSM